MQSHTTRWGYEDKTQLELNDMFFALKSVLKRKLNICWHYKYLDKYISENMIPFGLRLKVFPHFRKPSQTFKEKWKNTLSDCFFNLMKLLIEEHKKEIETIDLEIQAVNNTFVSLNAPEGKAEKEKELNLALERSSRETISKKERKMTRDRKAFSLKQAYIWPSSLPQRQWKCSNNFPQG